MTKCRNIYRPRNASMAEVLEFYSIPEPNSGCWLWMGALSDRNRASIRADGKMRIASRVSWETHRGPIPEGMLVCHKCDVPACVNPDHLFLGTNLDNMRDKIAKGRQGKLSRTHQKGAKGERNRNAKLTIEQVRAIRCDTRSRAEIAAIYRILPASVGKIQRGTTWGHI